MFANRRLSLTHAAELADYEQAWPKMHEFLDAKGYELRKRYRPGWVPSWTPRGGSNWPKTGWPEDSIIPRTRNFIDAKRDVIRDGKRVRERVGLKLVKLDEKIGVQEIEILEYLSSREVRDDPRNPCIPLLEILHPPSHPNQRLLVMPLLYEVISPPLKRKSECVEFLRQILRGMEFLHGHKIAHKDICPHNLVVHAPGLYPEGCHPMDNTRSEDGLSYAEIKDLRKVKPTYYFIDFGLSIMYGSPKQRWERRPLRGRYSDVPEYDRPGPWDGYKVDIYCMGLLIDELVVKRRKNMDFLGPLVEWMTREEPSERPTAQQAVEWFDEATSGPKWRRTLGNVFSFLQTRSTSP
ncbi:kinase-like protein [Rickenella mellea]|uniref:Kinase-like protein n=1 Tax=Rickenella mellea TaxID=50990 RepID=A0A4Y7Q4C0_9AGAM|nr:kinase-like protein [Rickenella mellea]